jgi:hypothetical protein
MHLQGVLMPMVGAEDFIAQEKTSRSSKTQVGVQKECKTHYPEVFDMSVWERLEDLDHQEFFFIDFEFELDWTLRMVDS